MAETKETIPERREIDTYETTDDKVFTSDNNNVVQPPSPLFSNFLKGIFSIFFIKSSEINWQHSFSFISVIFPSTDFNFPIIIHKITSIPAMKKNFSFFPELKVDISTSIFIARINSDNAIIRENTNKK